MRLRPRTPDDPGARCLPTRTIRIACGRVTVEREMGSGRTESVRLDLHLTDDEWEAMVREREAVKV